MAFGGVDLDPMDATFSPTGWTDIHDNDRGAVASWMAIRDSATVASDYVQSAIFGINAGDDSASVAFIIEPYRFTNAIDLAASANITDAGENTTAQLTAPTTGEFLAGRMHDTENPSETVSISSGGYTEMEWNLEATNLTTDGEVYDFRMTRSGTIFDLYSTTASWTIGTAGGGGEPGEERRDYPSRVIFFKE